MFNFGPNEESVLKVADVAQKLLEYYGKGEVYDNSDIGRIEVRFGNDVRFLNKDDLVSKKLLSKYEDRYNG